MSARKFRFVSPGIFLNEIDRSQIADQPENIGPVIIGRSEKGPGMVPTKVSSFSEFVETFGNPIAGIGGPLDVWREGNYSAPTYAAYAAQAYLRSGAGPITFMRLMGTQSPDAVTTGGQAADGTGYAGWTTIKTPNSSLKSNGGAYGLFLFKSSSQADGGNTGSAVTNAGTLAAIFYVDSGSVPVLVGTKPLLGSSDTFAVSGTATAITSDNSGNFRIEIRGGDDGTTVEDKGTFNLQEGSSNFIRKVFNTNPQLVNTTIEDSAVTKSYWLGETFERYAADNVTLNSRHFGVILAVASGSGFNGPAEKTMPYRDAHSGWYFSQNLNAEAAAYEYDDMTKLFKFVGINGYGAWLNSNIKISVDNIRASNNDATPYGTFDIAIRRADDSDLKPVVLERYSNCDLDPASPNYIATKIGDMKMVYDDTTTRYREYGNYPNVSKYVRVVVNPEVENGGANPALLPFGVFGPPRFKSWTYFSNSVGNSILRATANGHPSATAYALGGGSIPMTSGAVGINEVAVFAGAGLTPVHFGTASISYPSLATRLSASDDSADITTTAYFGVQVGKTATTTTFDPGYSDYVRPLGRDVISDSAWGDTYGLGGYGSNLTPQFVFSLDEIKINKEASSFSNAQPSRALKAAYFLSGSYKAGTSWNSADSIGDGATRFQNILDSKVNRFTGPMYGGYDGLDIKERDPFRNTKIDDSVNPRENYAFYSIRRAIDTVADPEVIEYNLITIPGIYNATLTKHLIDTVETRADALAIVDIQHGFTPRHEAVADNADASARKGEIDQAISTFKNRSLDSSYACTYYPWVRVRDDINNTFLYMPPSVAALGVLGSTEVSDDVWFAPAGFRRGGLSQGASGLQVVGVEQKLTSRERDDLYDVNINPIASFPSEGVVIFGQKTLQATRSALDRINVRRLMIFVKRGISQISSQTIFQPNVQTTWKGFKAKADAFLNDVKIRFGVDDFRVILDETTTTPDLVDRNIMYAKIFIKPTRAIEFIAIDFIITRSGASFED